MGHWFLPQILSDDALQAARQAQELVFAPDGLPDLARAQGPDQISAWLKRLYPEATPEHIAGLTEHYWRLGHDLLPDDTVVMRVRDGQAYLIGEVAGVYRRENRAQGMCHVWPMKWQEATPDAGTLPALAAYAACAGLTEITDEDALQSLAPYVPMLRKGNASLFRWVAIGTLIFELIYFWPRGQKY
jgi:hypothetical protein